MAVTAILHAGRLSLDAGGAAVRIEWEEEEEDAGAEGVEGGEGGAAAAGRARGVTPRLVVVQ